MIRAVLGEDKWVEGLQNCLKNNKYKNVGYEILLDSYGLDHVEGTEKNIRQLFEPYFLQMGYPILFVNLNTDEMRIDISANRYLDSNDDPLTPESSFGY
jgi:aminopeptidase N